MKIMFCVLPAYGHVYPVMPLALAARDAGHEVTVATTDVFLPKMAALGLATVDVGMTVEQARDQLLASLSAEEMPKTPDGRPDIEMGGRLFIDIAGRRTADELAPHLRRRRPDLVVYEPYDLGAAVAAHLAGIPAVCHALSPRLPEGLVRAMAGDHLRRLWAEHGVVAPSFDVFTGDAYLDIVPTALQDPSFLTDPRRLPMRPVPFAEPGATLPAWVGRRGRPLIYLTLGTVVATDDVLRPVVDGLGELDADVLLALGAADGTALGSIPSNVHVEHFVDQPAILAHADLAVHHGGSGTILGATDTWRAAADPAEGCRPVLERRRHGPRRPRCRARTSRHHPGDRRPSRPRRARQRQAVRARGGRRDRRHAGPRRGAPSAGQPVRRRIRRDHRRLSGIERVPIGEHRCCPAEERLERRDIPAE